MHVVMHFFHARLMREFNKVWVWVSCYSLSALWKSTEVREAGVGGQQGHMPPNFERGGQWLPTLLRCCRELLRLIFFVICIFKHIWKHADQIFFWMLHCVRLSCWQSVTTWTTLLTTVFIMIILTIMMNSYRSEQNRNKTYFRQG